MAIDLSEMWNNSMAVIDDLMSDFNDVCQEVRPDEMLDDPNEFFKDWPEADY